jgi:hypothetical protein
VVEGLRLGNWVVKGVRVGVLEGTSSGFSDTLGLAVIVGITSTLGKGVNEGRIVALGTGV